MNHDAADLAHFPWYFRPRTLRLGLLRLSFCAPQIVEGLGVVRIPGERGFALVFGPWNLWMRLA